MRNTFGNLIGLKVISHLSYDKALKRIDWLLLQERFGILETFSMANQRIR